MSTFAVSDDAANTTTLTYEGHFCGRIGDDAASQPTSVLASVVPVVEAYLHDFGLTDQQFAAIESRILVGRAMSQLDAGVSHDDLIRWCLRAAFEQRDEWAFVASQQARDAVWSGCSSVPTQEVTPMARQRVHRPFRLKRQRTVRPALT